MRQDLIVAKSIIINTSPEKLWNVLTDPETIKEYLFGTETKTDWEVGSAVIFQGEYEGHYYKDKGLVIANIPGALLSYRYWSQFSGLEDKPENYATITYELIPVNHLSTEFRWTQKGYANEEGYRHSVDGMEGFLQQIKRIAER